MFSVIFRLTIRNLIKNKLYHLISITGLTLSMASAFFILIWINHELSYDRFHPYTDRLFRLTFEYHSKEHQSHFARSYQNWVLQIPGYFPEVEQMIRLQPMRNAMIRIGESKFYNSRFSCADSAFFQVFGYELMEGDPEKVLVEPKSMVISETLSKKYFGNENPVGQQIFAGHQFDTLQQLYTITGIMKDFPANSHIHIDILGSIDDPKQHIGWAYIYLLIHRGADTRNIIAKFPEFLKQLMDEEQVEDWTTHLQPIRDIHLYSHKDREIEQNGKAQNVYIFILVAFILLIIAMINYANIQLAGVNKKMSFIFLNRVTGARIRDILKFIAFESAIHNLIALLLALILLMIGLPTFNRFFGYQIDPDRIFVWMQIIGLGMLLAVVGIVTGSYPVLMLRTKEKLFSISGRIFYHTGFKIIPGGGKFSGRKLMIMLQFLGSVILIMSTILIYLQLNYMLKTGIGSRQPDILVLKNLPRPVLDQYIIFKKELLANPLILEVSATMEEPGHEVLDAMQFEMDRMDESIAGEYLSVLPVDHSFLDFFDIPLVAGKNFPDYGGMEANEYYIINESALKKLGFNSPEDALDHQFKLIFQWPDIFKGGRIIGVSEDFHFYSMTRAIKPMVMFQKHIFFWCFVIRVDEQNFTHAIEYLKLTWEKIYPDYPLEYHFVDDLYAEIYETEILQAKVVGIFALLTMMIACFGLLGMIMYITEIRTKEIGIRKVNGAGVFRILLLLNGEILIWIFLALISGIPITWYIINSWLQDFVYRIDIHWGIFVLAGFIIIVLSLLSTSFQTYRATKRNPIESLRYE